MNTISILSQTFNECLGNMMNTFTNKINALTEKLRKTKTIDNQFEYMVNTKSDTIRFSDNTKVLK